MHPFQNLPEALTKLRAAAEKTQAEVSEATGLSKSALSKYENGRKVPELSSLGKLLVFYGGDAHVLAAALEPSCSIDMLRARLKGAQEEKGSGEGGGSQLRGADTGAELLSAVKRALREIGIEPPAGRKDEKQELKLAVL